MRWRDGRYFFIAQAFAIPQANGASNGTKESFGLLVDQLVVGQPDANHIQLKMSVLAYDDSNRLRSGVLKCTGFNAAWSAHDQLIRTDDVLLTQAANLKWNEYQQHTLLIRYPLEDGDYWLLFKPIFQPRNDLSDNTHSLHIEIAHDRYGMVFVGAMAIGLGLAMFVFLVFVLRIKFHLHLSTCVVLLLVTGGLLALNSKESYSRVTCSSGAIENPYSFQASTGWPWLNREGSTKTLSIFVADALVFDGILISVAIVMELLFRPKKLSAEPV